MVFWGPEDVVDAVEKGLSAALSQQGSNMTAYQTRTLYAFLTGTPARQTEVEAD